MKNINSPTALFSCQMFTFPTKVHRMLTSVYNNNNNNAMANTNTEDDDIYIVITLTQLMEEMHWWKKHSRLCRLQSNWPIFEATHI